MDYWITKSKETIKIVNLTTPHLKNCIALVEANYQKYYQNVKDANRVSSDMFSIDEVPYIQEILSIEEKYPVYKALKLELAGRQR